jgi:hypothetical protein
MSDLTQELPALHRDCVTPIALPMFSDPLSCFGLRIAAGRIERTFQAYEAQPDTSPQPQKELRTLCSTLLAAFRLFGLRR